MAITFCSEDDVYDLVGNGKSSFVATVGSALRVQRMINRAEGKIVSATRQDWIAGYTNTTSQNKELLREATAAKAAMDVVKFDGRGFISRTEQQTILDVLDDQFRNALNELKDLDISKTRSVGG